MARKKSKPFKIDSGAASKAGPIVSGASTAKSDGKVHVNLRYFQKNVECFSSWQAKELKGFSSWVEKMSTRTPTEVQSTTKTCHAHVGKTKSPPQSISRDVKLYGLDVGAKNRVHGFFSGNDFFLLWLDRNHKILK